jgi:hypothetical protein
MSTTQPIEPRLNKHLHVVLDEATYQRLRKVAFDQQVSIGELVRQALVAYLPTE